jgi:hypothetical protein
MPSVSSLYGTLPFPGVQPFVERVALMESAYFAPARFSTYLTTLGGESHYGLELEELLPLFERAGEEIASMVSNGSSPEGRTVNLNIRFPSKGARGTLTFVIAGKSAEESQAMRLMLEGLWSAGEAAPHAEPSLAEQLAEALAQPEPPALPWRAIGALRDQFPLDERLEAGTFLGLLTRLSASHFPGNAFRLRLVPREGAPQQFPDPESARPFLERRLGVLARVSADLATAEGQRADITLDLLNGRRELRLELQAADAEGIRAEIRRALENPARSLSTPRTMVHEVFTFNEAAFSLDTLLPLMQEVARRFLENAPFQAFLSTVHGETHAGISLSYLPVLWEKYREQVSLLLLGVNQSLSGQTFSLTLQFSQGPRASASGTLSMLWGDERLHRELSGLIYSRLEAKPYRPGDLLPASAAPAGQPTMRLMAAVPRPRTCAVVMPLDSYWSDPLWEQLEQVLLTSGWEAWRVGNLFREQQLSRAWQQLAEAELVLADLTYKHPEVYYLTGVAHALGRKVLIISQHGRDIPPDFQAFAPLVYDYHLQGVQLLTDRLAAWLRLNRERA